MQTITKFQIGRMYYPSEKCILLQILERNGKELKVARIRQSGKDVFTITTTLTADEKGAYEYFIYEGVRIPATNLLPQGRRLSELPPEEQKIIKDAIMRDVEHRKANNLDSADILTEHAADADGNVTITHRVIKEK
ncbi:MAG: hypothetical protein KBT20_05655 [Bacteroidales bacterium]|nr:hypothetical protein [Candidatus Liminaster caballi]